MPSILAGGPFHSYFSVQINQTIQSIYVLLTFCGQFNFRLEFGLYADIRNSKVAIPVKSN